MEQITNTILMIRPTHFRMNEETAVNNYFQKDDGALSVGEINSNAQQEFDVFVNKLQEHGVRVIVLNSKENPITPDAVFPNNWVSFHADGTVGVYPMFAKNRRNERREDVFEVLEENGFRIDQIIDYTEAEEDNVFLEGTGSIILDRNNRIAYCALSNRADEGLFIEFCEDFDYYPVPFTANQSVSGKRKPIYHTNVMMAIGEEFAIICLDSIDDKKERKEVVRQLTESGKKIIKISESQMHHFAGNMLQVKGKDNSYLVMSKAAYNSLTNDQIAMIKSYCDILYSPLDIIEKYGGGSARCMMAEVFLPQNLINIP